jgi:two-component system, NtrC family, response regulator AtoC
MPDDRALPVGCEVLVVDDDVPLRRRLTAHLRRLGAEVTEAGTLAEVRRLVPQLPFDFALLDLHLPDGEGLSLLREGIFSPNTGVVVMTAFGSIEKAVMAIRLGAGDYLAKPFELTELPLAFLRCRSDRRVQRREEHGAAEKARESGSFHFGPSLTALRQKLQAIIAADERLGTRLPPILLEGETGTGKSALAHWIHQAGPRRAAPLVALNCAALPEGLVEAELFGHERGAYTDARHARLGLFEAADGGTLFLDEISSLNLCTQAKLLTAIEDGRIRRVGATKELPVDVRVITASNRALAELAAAGSFRPDLLHRLNLLALTLPPLRERGSDILALAHHLLTDLGRRHRRPGLSLAPIAQARLLGSSWAGNVRELAHELERAIIFETTDTLQLTALGALPSAAAPASWRNPAWRLPETGFSLDAMIGEVIAEALRETNQNVSAAARRLGVSRDFLRYRLESVTPAT